jgi:23S rRNA pseudouridine1911/1915/1917 synthase
LETLSFYHPDWPVFYQDNHVLALYKPAGLLVQGDITGDISLLELGKAWLKERHKKPGNVFLGMVHRLDRPVAGVMLFARTSKAARRLSDQFRKGTIAKTYLAILQGRPAQDSGKLVNLIERGEGRSSFISKDPSKAQQARLSFTVIETIGSKTLIKVILETGRKHQIRLQFAHIGCPIEGDIRYGADAPLPSGQIALLASSIAVDHPTTKLRMRFESPVPRGWPWPPSQFNSIGPLWNWKDLYPHVCGLGASNPCSFPKTVQE